MPIATFADRPSEDTMQPDTTLTSHTVIDYTTYRRAAQSARTSAMADRATRRLALRLAIVWAAVIAIVTAAVGIPARVNSCHECANVRAERIDDRGRAALLVRGPGSQIEGLRARAEVLAEADPQRWWQAYGKTTTRSQAQAAADVARQIAELERLQAAAAHPETSGQTMLSAAPVLAD